MCISGGLLTPRLLSLTSGIRRPLWLVVDSLRLHSYHCLVSQQLFVFTCMCIIVYDSLHMHICKEQFFCTCICIIVLDIVAHAYLQVHMYLHVSSWLVWSTNILANQYIYIYIHTYIYIYIYIHTYNIFTLNKSWWHVRINTHLHICMCKYTNHSDSYTRATKHVDLPSND